MGFMEKMLDKNLDVLKKSIEIQNQAHARAVEEARRRGVPPPAAPKLPDFIQRVLEHSEEVKARLAQQKKTHHPAETTNHKVTPTPSSASAKAVPNQTSHHPHASPLPNHLEELFAELAARRDRIDELKQLLEEEKRQVVTHKEHIAEQKATEERLRSQLRAVDAKTVQQADELLSLKEKLKEMKELEARVECLKREIRLQKPSLESVEKKDTTIQSLTARVHAAEVELGRYEKRIERLRTQSPGMVALIQTVHMFLEKASPEKSSTMEVLPSSLAPPQRVSETAVHVETVLLEVMRRYRAELTELWPDTASRIGARTLLLRAARHYLLHTIPYARYDARIISTSKTHPTVRITKHVRQLLASMQHCTITSACNGTELHVKMPILPTQNTACMLFPYGTLRVLLDTAHRVNTHPESGQTPGGFDATLQAELGAMADELTVVPYLSRATIDQEPFGRTSILYETTRSSKPGGQAANVTETHVSARLLFDGDVVARAECQDTRSQHENRKIVEERLLVERVAKHNVDLELEAQRSAPRIQSPLSKIPSELNSILFPSGGRTSDAVTQDSHPVGDLEEESLLDRSILRLLFSSSHTPRGY